jgi:hypothetical protein
MGREYAFGKSVKLGFRITAVLLGLLVLTLPLAIWFWLKAGKGRLQLTAGGWTVHGLGLSAEEWSFAELQRIGTLRVRLPNKGLGGVLAKMTSGGDEAVNLCAITKDGKKKQFLVSRYENAEDIINHVAGATGLHVETVSQGLTGAKWQAA